MSTNVTNEVNHYLQKVHQLLWISSFSLHHISDKTLRVMKLSGHNGADDGVKKKKEEEKKKR